MRLAAGGKGGTSSTLLSQEAAGLVTLTTLGPGPSSRLSMGCAAVHPPSSASCSQALPTAGMAHQALARHAMYIGPTGLPSSSVAGTVAAEDVASASGGVTSAVLDRKWAEGASWALLLKVRTHLVVQGP